MSSIGVVVHLLEGEPDRQGAVLTNVTNLRRSLGPDVPVELVAHGAGVTLLTGETGLESVLVGLIHAGVLPLACNNTLDARHLTQQHLAAGVDLVDSGVAHLARRQLEGWAYLRP